MNKQLITSVSIVKNIKLNLASQFDAYLDAIISNGYTLLQLLQKEPPEKLITVEEVINYSDDVLADIGTIADKNTATKEKNCPIYEQPNTNLPTIPGMDIPPIPELPDLGFLQELNIPIEAMVAMLGGVGKSLVKAATEYAASQIRDELIKMSQGYECIIELANKMYIAMNTVADSQYLMAQPVITPVGSGMVLPI